MVEFHIEVVGVWSICRVVGDEGEARIILDQACSFEKEGAAFSELYKRKLWDGRTRLYSYKKQQESFMVPTGLVPILIEACRIGEVSIQVEIHRCRPTQSPEIQTMEELDGITLRPYQSRMVEVLLQEPSDGLPVLVLEQPSHERLFSGVGLETPFRLPGMGIWWSATGSGKTIAAAALIGRLGVPTLFMVDGNLLVQQTKDRFEQCLATFLSKNNLKIGIAMEGKWDPQFITVAGTDTLLAVLDRPSALIKRASKALKSLFGKVQKCPDALEQSRLTQQLVQAQKDLTKRRSAGFGDLITDICGGLQEEFPSALVDFHEKRWLLEKEVERLEEFLKSRQLLIMDEGHDVAADGPYSICMACAAYYRVLMSGTPLARSDNENLKAISAFGGVIEHVTNKEMVQQGVIPKAVIEMITIRGSVHGGWPDCYEEGVVLYEPRNMKVIRKIQEYYFQGKRILVLFQRIEHGRRLSDLLWSELDSKGEETFIPHEVLDGEDPLDLRMDIIGKVREGILKIVLASNIFQRGVDVPEFDVVINACGGKGVIPVLQRLGRGLRGEELRMVDFIDRHHQTLLTHSNDRLRIYKEEGCFTILIDGQEQQIEPEQKPGQEMQSLGFPSLELPGLEPRKGFRIPKVPRPR